MRKQKIISLTDSLYDVASEMENFSKWVRDRLEEHIQKSKSDENKTTTYVCKPCGIEFQRLPVKDRLRGLRFPSSVPCAACGSESFRWDVA